jgi:hypothetical protein
MIENTENTTPVEQGATATPATPAELVIADLEAKVKQLEQQLQWAKDARDYNGKKLDQVREYIQASIDNGDWEDSELEEIFWEELADKLDLEIKREVEITITTYWRATVKMPRGEDISELAYHISVDDPELSHPTAEFIDIEVGDTSVSRY